MHRQWIRRHYTGFTLIEILLSLSVAMIILLNCSILLKAIKPFNKEYNIDSSLQNGIATLSYELVCSHQMTYGQELTYYNEKEESCQVKLDQDQLVITPGYNILCDDIEKVYFYNKNGLVYIDCTFQKKEFTFLIGSDYENKEEG